MIHYYNGEVTETKLDFTRKTAWVERLTDFSVIVKEVIKGNLNMREIYNSYKIEKEYAVWSSKDKLPFFMYVLMSPLLFFKRK